MLRCHKHRNRKPNYWLNREFSLLKSSCLRARGLYIRTRMKPGHRKLEEEYRGLRSNLKKAICASMPKRICGALLQGCNGQDTWTKSLQVTCSQFLLKIIITISPLHLDERLHLKAQQDDILIPEGDPQKNWR